MAAKDHLNKILFHASMSQTPPHEGNTMAHGNTFHLGTLEAGIDRITYSNFTDDEFAELDENVVPQVNAYMHVYEAEVPENLHIHHDPHGAGYDEFVYDEWDPDKAIDERKVKDIAAYENLHEHPGSISYVMHKNMLRNNRARFVGTMPFTVRGEENDRYRIIKELGYD